MRSKNTLRPRLLSNARGFAHHVVLLVIVLGIVVVGTYVLVASHADTNNCYTWNNTSGSLQNAIYANTCVQVAAGTWDIPAYIGVPAQHVIVGASANPQDTVLKAAAPWNANGNEGVLNTVNASDNVQVSNLTIDANNLATYGLASRGMTVTNVVVKNAKCSGIGIAGGGMHINGSTLTANGFSCPVAPPGNGIYAEGAGSDKNYAPTIEKNTIYSNGGPGIDINGVDNGTLTNNLVYSNKGWAAVSLYGSSGWTVTGNHFSEPDSKVVSPYHLYCSYGLPMGAGSAGLMLCQDTDVNNYVTANNVIDSNQISGHYGIVSIGADEKHPYWAPRNNSITNNNVFGSNVGCVDDFKPGQWLSDKNIWTNNNCAGKANTPPTYF